MKDLLDRIKGLASELTSFAIVILCLGITVQLIIGEPLFGWNVVKHVKSNAIVYAGCERTLGVGAGQMSRVDSSRIAVWKAGEAGLSLDGSIVASDAFFPFADGLIAAAEAGAIAAIQPGGSVRDEEVITAADERDMVMVFTNKRHFKH